MIGFKNGSRKCIIDFKVYKNENNDRKRSRMSQRKSNSNDIALQNFEDLFAQKTAQFALLWSWKYNGGNEVDKYVFNIKLPSLNQIMSGLKEYLEVFIHKKIEGANERQIKLILANFKSCLDEMILKCGIPDVDKPFNINSGDPIYSLWNPNSCAVHLMLWLYSMEPPLYFSLNEACRSLDQHLLSQLGPFAAAISTVLFYAEMKRKDKV